MPMKSIPKQPDWTLPALYGSQSSHLPPSQLVCGRCGKGAIPDVDVRAGGGISLEKKKILFRYSVYLCFRTVPFAPLVWIFLFF